MVPAVLLAADPSSTEAMVIAGLGAVVAFLSGIVSSILIAKLGGLTKAIDGLGHSIVGESEKRHALEITITELKGFAQTAHARLSSLESNALTKPIFDLSMGAQNRILGEQTDMLKRHDARLSALVEDVVGHEEQLRKRSSSTLQAQKPRAPIPRTDGPVERLPEDAALGPMRPQLKSQQIK